jgi:hypothetical protein
VVVVEAKKIALAENVTHSENVHGGSVSEQGRAEWWSGEWESGEAGVVR